MRFLDSKYVRLGIVVILVFTVAGFVFAVLPLRVWIAAENDEMQKAVVRVEHARAKIGQLAEFRMQNEEILAHEDEVSPFLSRSDFPVFIESLEKFGQECGGEIVVEDGGDPASLRKESKKSAKADATSRLIESIPEGDALLLSISFTGSFPAVANFLHKVETMPYFLDVLSIDIDALDPNAEGPSSRSESGSGLFFQTRTDKMPAPVAAVAPEPLQPVVKAVFSILVHTKNR